MEKDNISSTNRNQVANWVIISLIILFSFLNFSYRYYPLLNSDHAVTILMTPGFSMTNDLYFWGQDRAGSLVPMLAHILHISYRFPPVWAVSIIQYLLLILGFLATASFFRTQFSKVLLAIVWFFPSWHFLDHVTLLFGIQTSMLMIALYFYRIAGKENKTWKALIWTSLLMLSLITCVWVSDMGIVSVLLLALFALIDFYKKVPGPGSDHVFSTRHRMKFIILVIVWIFAGALFLLYAKHKAFAVASYSQHMLNHPWEIISSIKEAIMAVFQVLIFSSESTIESIYAWMIVAGIPVFFSISGNARPLKKFFIRNEWMSFFFLNGIILLGVIFFSHWVFLNGTGRRYFTVPYISFWIAFLMFYESTLSSRLQLRKIILTVMVLTGAVSSFDKFYFPHRIPSRIQVLSEFSQLGDIGIIGEYSNAYLVSAVDPGHIKATPHDKDENRNFNLVDETFNQPRLYLIRDGWMKSFPDTLKQYGHIIVKRGNEMYLGDCYICRYERLLLHEEFTWKDMQHQGTLETDTSARNGQAIRIGADFDKKRHFIYGPFITLDPGKVTITFRLRSTEYLKTEKVAVLEITADYGKKTLESRTLRACDFGQMNAYQDFSIPLELDKRYSGMEFRILYLGHADLTFDRVDVDGR
ncbi:MAG: hypothetical protein Q8867_05720 [Bacteroidota bacterium]|nr:hypothetical protein [Bacteroidota bacterium]